ncbi:MAG: hypothetical protein KKB51_06640 [Candidatus Riflebacteria bacterium]|nr:hypothetical protein [Candidatus Riflebacteria bacterium]
MFNNKDLQVIFIKVALASFVLTLLIAAPYIAKRASGKTGESAGGAVERAGEKLAVKAVSEGADDVFALFKTGKASEKQVKPSFGNLPNELFPGNRPFSLDFHKMPVEYLVPPAPEVTRTSILRIRELKMAELEAIEAQQAMAKNYDKSPENGSIR